MMGARRSTAITCALLALGPVPAVAASAAGQYAGRTSQRAPISFTISRGHVRALRFTIYIRCPSRHIWRIAASNFPPIKIVNGAFAQRFLARGNRGSASVRGRLSSGRMRGTVFDRTYEPKEYHFCSGLASYDLAPSGGAGRRPPADHGGGHPKKTRALVVPGWWSNGPAG